MKGVIAALIFSLFAGLAFANTDISPSPYKVPPQIENSRFSGLSAVLVVGHQEDGTPGAIKRMDEIGAFLEEKGVKVNRFYDQEAIWEDIVSASRNASFFIYAGHGSTLGYNSSGSGGLCIEPRSVSGNTIVQELKLKENAIVIFKSVCRGAGSSAGDNGDIGIKEARRRVTDYSEPFFEIGASAYFADNLGSGCLNFLKDFFDGKNIKSCFEEATEFWAEIEMIEGYEHDKNKKIGIASTDWGGTAIRTTYIGDKKYVEEVPASKGYKIAFVAEPGFTIEDVLE